jgi:hypothetical protein
VHFGILLGVAQVGKVNVFMISLCNSCVTVGSQKYDREEVKERALLEINTFPK